MTSTRKTFPSGRLTQLLGCELPIIQAPMAGANDQAMAIAVTDAGGLGSLPCAMLSPEQLDEVAPAVIKATRRCVNFNFFCHKPEPESPEQASIWQAALGPYYDEHNIDPDVSVKAPTRAPFSDALCDLVEKHRPRVISFHFGLPDDTLLERTKATGAIILGCATTVNEAIWLEAKGVDAVIAQGAEAGGHRGLFLSDDVSSQPGTFALVPQIAEAIKLPVIAAGGIASGQGIAAAFALGADGVQIGTAYLNTPEAIISRLHREALQQASDSNTAMTNLFSGKPARGIVNRIMRELGPMSDKPTVFPTAGAALAPLKRAAETNGKADFTSLWSGQAAALGVSMPAAELTLHLAESARDVLQSLSA